MLAYVKNYNEQTGNYSEVFLGTDVDNAIKEGFVLTEVELGDDDKYYTIGYAPKKSLEDAKIAAKAILKEYRLEVEHGGTYIDGNKWDTEVKDEVRLLSAESRFSSGVTEIPNWKIQDGVYVTLTPELLKVVHKAMEDHLHQSFVTEAIKQMEIDACTTVEELDTWLENNLKVGW